MNELAARKWQKILNPAYKAGMQMLASFIWFDDKSAICGLSTNYLDENAGRLASRLIPCIYRSEPAAVAWFQGVERARKLASVEIE